MRVRTSVDEARLRAPLVSAHGSVDVRSLVLLELDGGDGLRGHGEAAPLSSYDGVDHDQVLESLERCRPLLEVSDGREIETLLAQCSATGCPPQALAAIDLALWDLAGRRTGEPVWRLLGAVAPTPVEVNATMGALDPRDAARQAVAAVGAGFRTVKLKVGTGADLDRVRAVRVAVGPELAIRLDANGAWPVDDAIAMLGRLEPLGIECCEEPVHGLDEIEHVAEASTIAISLDESAGAAGALERRVCDAVCLKISASGGITGVLRDAARARQVGYGVYLASTLDGPLGISAALHCAMVLAPDRACGLATSALFARSDAIPSWRGTMTAPPGSGLGDDLVGWYRPAAGDPRASRRD